MRKLRIALSALFATTLLVGGIAAANPSQDQKYDYQRPEIQKLVKDVTTGGAFEDANTAGDALAVNVGDTLVYRIVVKGDVKWLDIKDTPPAGVTFVSQKGSFDLDKNSKKTVDITVKATDAGLVQNTACLAFEKLKHLSESKTDLNSSRLVKLPCDDAWVNMVVPTVTPTPSVSPSPTPVVVQPTVITTLPSVGGGGHSRP